MSWVTVIWSMLAAFCLSLALAHLLIGVLQRSVSSLLFAAVSVSAGGIAACELVAMRATAPHAWGLAIRWIHVPIFVLVASLVLFVRVYFRAGRPWLAAAVITTRGAALLVNFLREPNLNFVEISGLRRIPFLGEEVAIADGLVSRWTRLGELSSILLLAFLVDAAVTSWRGGDRRAAIRELIMVAFVVLAAGTTALEHADVLRLPYLISVSYIAIIVMMGHDLTRDVLHASELARDLRRSEEALRESDERVTLAVEAAGLGFWSWDAHTDEAWMTATGRAIRGIAADGPLDGARLFSSVHPDDRDRLLKIVSGAADTGGRFDCEYRVVRSDGEVRWIAEHGSGSRAGADRRGRTRGASFDVTERKRAEMEARRRDEEVAHLTRVLTLGELSGSLAHELNQPLTSILCSAQAGQKLMEADPAAYPSEMSEILADIVQEERHASEVITRLRNLLKKGDVSAEALAVPDLVSDVLQLMRAELVRHAALVTTDVAAGLPLVRGDRVQIEQVLLNLVANACDSMVAVRPENRRLDIRASRNGNGTVELAVADRGSGIPPGDIERIFEPFVTTKTKGLGLGLAVCRTIVSAHGGRLWAVNNTNGGASFRFTLPIAEGPAA
jgi:PAS domain S-box-containing protein